MSQELPTQEQATLQTSDSSDGSYEQRHTYFEEQFFEEFADDMYFLVQNKDAALRIKEYYDMITHVQAQASKDAVEKFNISEVIGIPETDEFIFVLTEQGENDSNVEKLWVSARLDFRGRGLIEAHIFNQETPEGLENKEKVLSWLFNCGKEKSDLQESIYDYMEFNPLLEIPTGRKDSSILELEAEIEYIGDVSVLKMSNIVREQYTHDKLLGKFYFNGERSAAVIDHLKKLVPMRQKLQLEPITQHQYQSIIAWCEEKSNDEALDRVLLGDGGAAPQTSRKKKKSTMKPGL